jgi:hypothetical protein
MAGRRAGQAQRTRQCSQLKKMNGSSASLEQPYNKSRFVSEFDDE